MHLDAFTHGSEDSCLLVSRTCALRLSCGGVSLGVTRGHRTRRTSSGQNGRLTGFLSALRLVLAPTGTWHLTTAPDTGEATAGPIASPQAMAANAPGCPSTGRASGARHRTVRDVPARVSWLSIARQSWRRGPTWSPPCSFSIRCSCAEEGNRWASHSSRAMATQR